MAAIESVTVEVAGPAGVHHLCTAAFGFEYSGAPAGLRAGDQVSGHGADDFCRLEHDTGPGHRSGYPGMYPGCSRVSMEFSHV